MKLNLERFDMVPIVDNVVSLSKSMADKKGVSLDYLKIPEGSFYVEADSLRLNQAVLNLVSNAIKYNKPNGSVVISYEERDGGKVRLGIRDTGHGIAEHHKSKLFKPFERFDVDIDQIEGTGIGLSITKQMIELMNGTIGFESREGKGSYFYIDVPVSVQTLLPVHVEAKEETTQSLHNKTILYFEDIPANVELVRQILKPNEGIKLLAAPNAFVGIELAQSETPDLILMDIHMPGMDGLTAFSRLQDINKTRNIPVIALTADAMDADIKKALNMGFQDYITKPVEVHRFLKALDGVFK